MCEDYFIKSHLNGLVLDVENGFKLPGTPVTCWEKNGTDAQKWRDDHQTGTIRNKLTGFCLDLEGNRLVVNPYQSGKMNQQWERKDKVIANRQEKNMVLDIYEKDPKARVRVHPWKVNNGPNQCWTFELAP